MKKDLLFELKRKAVHVFFILTIAVYFVFSKYYGHYFGLGALGVILIVILIMEYFRVVLKKKIPFFHQFWREKEKDRLGGEAYLVISAIIVFAFFDFKIASVALLIVVFGDIAASLVGTAYGKHKINFLSTRKSWEGTFAELIVNLIVGFVILNNVVVILAMALTATVVEVMFSFVDDNLSVPVLAGLVGHVLTFFF